jgi:acetyl-CoA carboxylase biotin carboxyl carrier protein
MSKNILGIFDGSDIEGVSALIDKLEKSSFDYLKLEGDGMSIVIGKNGAGEVSEIIAAPAAGAAEIVRTEQAKAPVSPESPAVTESVLKSDAAGQDGAVVVKSPSYGLFYAQPEPGAPPYITIGAAVKAGETIGLVEIMKTFNAISSPVDGKVTEIHVKNQEVLEPGQPLVSIKAGA